MDTLELTLRLFGFILKFSFECCESESPNCQKLSDVMVNIKLIWHYLSDFCHSMQLFLTINCVHLCTREHEQSVKMQEVRRQQEELKRLREEELKKKSKKGLKRDSKEMQKKKLDGRQVCKCVQFQQSPVVHQITCKLP